MAKKEKKYHYIYKITNKLTNRYYIGMHSTDKLDDGYLGSGKILTRSIRKYGKDKFVKEILEYCDDRKSLSEMEAEYITEIVVKDKLCMNLTQGGEYWNTIGTVAVKDKNSNIFRVFLDDPRYLSGELRGMFYGVVNVRDHNGKNIQISKNDSRYLSGELKLITSHKARVKDIFGKIYLVEKDDPRYLSGELVGVTKGSNQSAVTKDKIKKSFKKNNHQQGNKNSQFGKRWVYSLELMESKSIKTEELDWHLNNGWFRGRKIKTF